MARHVFVTIPWSAVKLFMAQKQRTELSFSTFINPFKNELLLIVRLHIYPWAHALMVRCARRVSYPSLSLDQYKAPPSLILAPHQRKVKGPGGEENTFASTFDTAKPRARDHELNHVQCFSQPILITILFFYLRTNLSVFAYQKNENSLHCFFTNDTVIKDSLSV